jgi:hypothetical protein
VAASFIIVWDLDQTLGNFEALSGHGESREPIGVQLRPGLSRALYELSSAGFMHVVLTLATPLYAEVALGGTGIRHHFRRVEGLGQRGKGDAVGLATELGVAEDDRPHRMIFVGDHPYNDAPNDQRVLFHLEPLGLTRSASELVRLVLELRERGSGSLRAGFDQMHRGPWWRRLWPGRREGRPVYRTAEGLGRLVLVRRSDEAPVIGFAERPRQPAAPEECRFVPAEIAAHVRGMP